MNRNIVSQRKNHFNSWNPEQNTWSYTNNRRIFIRPYIPDKTPTTATTKHRKQKVHQQKKNGQTAKSRSIQIDIVISYNIIVCNRIRVPCPAGGRTSKNTYTDCGTWKCLCLYCEWSYQNISIFRSPAMFRFCVPLNTKKNSFFLLKNRNRGSIRLLIVWFCNE